MIAPGTKCYVVRDPSLIQNTACTAIVEVIGPPFMERCELAACDTLHLWYPVKDQAGRLIDARDHILVPITPPPTAESTERDAQVHA